MKKIRYGHKGCLHILPVDPLPKAVDQGRREATHACWCSFWKLDGTTMMVWRDGKWKKPHFSQLRCEEIDEVCLDILDGVSQPQWLSGPKEAV